MSEICKSLPEISIFQTSWNRHTQLPCQHGKLTELMQNQHVMSSVAFNRYCMLHTHLLCRFIRYNQLEITMSEICKLLPEIMICIFQTSWNRHTQLPCQRDKPTELMQEQHVRLSVSYHHKISKISHTKFQNLNVSHLGLRWSLRNILKPNVKWRMKM